MPAMKPVINKVSKEIYDNNEVRNRFFFSNIGDRDKRSATVFECIDYRPFVVKNPPPLRLKMTDCLKNEDENNKRMKITCLSEKKRMKITFARKKQLLSFPSFCTQKKIRAFGAYFLIKPSEIHLKSANFFRAPSARISLIKPLK